MAIAYVGDAHAAGTSTNHSPSYSSTGGNTLIITGDIFDASLSGVTISSITDNTGLNTWHFSTSNANNPPYSDEGASGETIVTFIAWCINANAITSVTVALTATCFANIDVSEWSGIGSADTGGITHVSSGATGTTIPSASIVLTGSGELVIATMDSAAAASVTAPAGTTKLPNASPNAFFPYELSQSGTVQWNWGCAANPGDYTTSIMAFAPPGGGTTHNGNAALSLVPTFGETVTHTAKMGAALALAPAFGETVTHTAKMGAALVVTPTFKAAKSTKTVGNFYPFNQNSTDEYYPFR